MPVRLNSKFDLRRFSKAVNGTVLPRLTSPTAEKLGYCDLVFVDKLGDTTVTIFRNKDIDSKIDTIVIRGATDNCMYDIERALDHGVNTFKGISRGNGRFLSGAGASEIALSQKLSEFGNTLPGLGQHALRGFAIALEVFPRALAVNSGINGTQLVNKMHLAHKSARSLMDLIFIRNCLPIWTRLQLRSLTYIRRSTR